jgi:hypothetical protein
MSFTAFNNVNHYLRNDAYPTKADFLGAAAAYCNAAENLGLYQAYTRAHPDTLLGLVTAIWNGCTPPAMPPPNFLNHLAGQVDLLLNNTVRPQGELQRQNERTQRLAHWTGVGAGAGTCPTLEEYAKQGVNAKGLEKLKITRLQMMDYLSLLRALAQPYLEETAINKFNQSHKQAVKLSEDAPGIESASDAELLEADGALKKTSEKWARATACANYWIQELPAVAGRSHVRHQMETWGGAGTADIIKRLVSEGEKDHVLTNQVISQGPGSYERHKWFYFRTGAPGVGHGWVLTINLRGAAIDFLMGMAQEVGNEGQKTSPHALLRKAHEHDCIGIHEDLLGVFKQHMVVNITGKKA